MGDPRLEGEEPDFDDKPRPKTKKQTGGHARARTFFTNQAASRYRVNDVHVGLLNTTIKSLKIEHGLTYDQIVDFMEYWFTRKDTEIRQTLASREPVSLSRWFTNGLKEHMVEVFLRERLQA